MDKRPGPALESVRLRRERGGTAAQVMHVGPWDAEQPTIAALMALIDEGYLVAGVHREVYLSDPERTPMERAHDHPLPREAGRPPRSPAGRALAAARERGIRSRAGRRAEERAR